MLGVKKALRNAREICKSTKSCTECVLAKSDIEVDGSVFYYCRVHIGVDCLSDDEINDFVSALTYCIGKDV